MILYSTTDSRFNTYVHTRARETNTRRSPLFQKLSNSIAVLSSRETHENFVNKCNKSKS